MKKRFSVSYNAPVTLTFALICTFILVIDLYLPPLKGKLIPLLFTVPGGKSAPVPFDWGNVLSYIRLFTHVFGHADWTHLLSNLTFILILGPLMEERFGSPIIALMITVTAAVTGVINACFLPTSLMGASGVSFMLIMLASISTITRDNIPVSFIFLLAVFIAKEFINPSDAAISKIAHITGGFIGSLFAFLASPKISRVEKITVTKPKKGKKTDAAARLEEIDADSPRNKSSSASNLYDEDKTIEIGTIKL